MKKTCLYFGAVAGLVASCALMTGCAGPAAQKPDETAVTVSPDCIPAQAVVHYYLADERHYFTQQQHAFCPDRKALIITSEEPQGRFQWTLQDGQYSASANAPEKPGPSDAYWNPALVGAAYCLMLYGGEFLMPTDSTTSEPVKIEGQYYLEINPQIRAMDSLRLYRNQTNGKTDLVLVTDNDGTNWMVKSYNWTYYAPTGKLIPRKLDFFDVSRGIASKKLTIRTDYAVVQ